MWSCESIVYDRNYPENSHIKLSLYVKAMNPRVIKVDPKPNFQLAITFDNGETGIYDCSGVLEFGVFKELKDENYFKKVTISSGTVSWPNEQDICPDTLYLDSKKTSSS